MVARGLGDPASATHASVGLILGVDGGHGRFQVFQCQIELIRIGLLRLPPERGLLEGRHQLLKPFDPLVLAGDLRNRLRFACCCRNQHRLQGGNVIGKIGGVQHDQKLPNSGLSCLQNLVP